MQGINRNTDRPARILVVEDEAVIAMEVESRLISMGYEVVGCAASGEQALAIARANKPDLALMDIHIRGDRDGIAVAAELRDQFGFPCVFLTAYGDSATIERASQTGPMGYLLKPFSDREIHAAIEIGLYREKMDRALRESREELQRKVEELQEALEKIRVLRGLLPICAWCKSIRNDQGYWEEISAYLSRHTEAELSHGICPACTEKHFPKKV